MKKKVLVVCLILVFALSFLAGCTQNKPKNPPPGRPGPGGPGPGGRGPGGRGPGRPGGRGPGRPGGPAAGPTIEYLKGVTLLYSEKESPEEVDFVEVTDMAVPETATAVAVKVPKSEEMPADKVLTVHLFKEGGEEAIVTQEFNPADASEKDGMIVFMNEGKPFEAAPYHIEFQEKDGNKMVMKYKVGPAVMKTEDGEEKVIDETVEGEKVIDETPAEETKEETKPEEAKTEEKPEETK
ncbi:MAG: hypothetical protein ACLFQV_09235 [Vulcanimicrobiota bacterium]